MDGQQRLLYHIFDIAIPEPRQPGRPGCEVLSKLMFVSC